MTGMARQAVSFRSDLISSLLNARFLLNACYLLNACFRLLSAPISTPHFFPPPSCSPRRTHGPSSPSRPSFFSPSPLPRPLFPPSPPSLPRPHTMMLLLHLLQSFLPCFPCLPPSLLPSLPPSQFPSQEPQPSTVNPQPSIYPQPSTLNPQPYPPKPKSRSPQTSYVTLQRCVHVREEDAVFNLNPERLTINPKPQVSDQDSSSFNPTPYTLHPAPCTLHPRT
jgi:hypothetical protein